MVHDHVTFRTARFNQTDVQPHFINDCCFGEDCARWLVGELRLRGWSDVVDPWQEDWGWQASGARGARKYLISIALVPEDEPEWMIHAEEHVGLLARLRGGSGAPLLPSLLRDIDALLHAATDIGDVRWHGPGGVGRA